MTGAGCDPVPDVRGPASATPPPDQLASVSHHERDGVVVAAVEGEIDVSNAAQIGRELTQISDQALGLVVDISRVEHLDSTGIALLYDLHLRTAHSGHGLVVVAPLGSAPRRVLEITAFGTRAALAEELEAAVAAARRGGEGTPAGE